MAYAAALVEDRQLLNAAHKNGEPEALATAITHFLYHVLESVFFEIYPSQSCVAWLRACAR